MSTNDVLVERTLRPSGDSVSGAFKDTHAEALRRIPTLLCFVPGLMATVDWCGIVATGYAANRLAASAGHPTVEIHPLAIVLAATLTLDFVFVLGGYTARCAFRSWLLQAKACSAWTASIICLVGMLALLGHAEDGFGPSAQLWYAAGLLQLMTMRAVISWWISHWRRQGKLLPKVAVLGAGREAADLAARLRETHEADVVGVFLEGERPTGIPGVAGTTDDLLSWAAAGKVDEVIVVSPWPTPSSLHRTMAGFATLQTIVSIQPALPPLSLAPLEFGLVGGVPAITVQRRPLSGWGAVAKRLEDIIMSALALFLLSPLLMVVAILVKLDSPGPVMFRQERSGFNNNRFLVYKFRTMRHDLSPDPLVPQALRNDPRVTRIGAILRRSSLDELPQLFNVLRGDMSLVGPRPHAAAHNEKYALLIDGYLARHRMKPGITGWAQVNGARGGTETPQQMRLRLEYDLAYIANWSLYLDFKVLVMTIPAVLRGTNAY